MGSGRASWIIWGNPEGSTSQSVHSARCEGTGFADPKPKACSVARAFEVVPID
jgi:hypothetical protein